MRCFFQIFVKMYSYEKMFFRISKSKFSADKLQNSCYIIRSLSLLRKNVYLSGVEKLYESINHENFMIFFHIRCF